MMMLIILIIIFIINISSIIPLPKFIKQLIINLNGEWL